MSGTKRYLVEHLDPELGQWSTYEYANIARESGLFPTTDTTPAVPGASARFWLTSVPASLELPAELAELARAGLLKTWNESVESMVLASAPSAGPASASTSATGGRLFPLAVPRARVCLLDPQAPADLSPADAALFDWFLFGGILGDDPPRDRTGELRRKGFPTRRLGRVQMTTDTAVRVTRMVVEQGLALDLPPEEEIAGASTREGPNGTIGWVDMPEIKVDRVESVEMPFRYVRGKDGEPIMPEGMLELIKKDSERGFDDFLPEDLKDAVDVRPDGKPL